MDQVHFGQVETPVGVVGVLAGPAGVRRVGWRLNPHGASTRTDETVRDALGQLREYFAGRRRDFDLPLEWPRLEPTTAAVLMALIGVGYGETVTYGELARRSGTGIPARAIGSIMGANPWPIVVPCHRVVPGSGGIGNYGGGVERKQRLLALEGVLLG